MVVTVDVVKRSRRGDIVRRGSQEARQKPPHAVSRDNSVGGRPRKEAKAKKKKKADKREEGPRPSL